MIQATTVMEDFNHSLQVAPLFLAEISRFPEDPKKDPLCPFHIFPLNVNFTVPPTFFFTLTFM